MKNRDIESYRIKRLAKRIKLKDVADYVSCSNSTISRLENEEDYQIKREKVDRYKEFIDNYDEIMQKREELKNL